MKIAIFADRFELGGVETHIIAVANELLSRGHHVLLSTAASYPELVAQIKGDEPSFRHVNWSSNPVDDVRDFDPDIIHAHPFQAIVRGCQAAEALQKPLIVNVHGIYDFGLDRSPLGFQVGGVTRRIIAVDLLVAKGLLDNAAYPEKVSIIRNGIDMNTFYPVPLTPEGRAELGLHSDWFTLVIVSRFADGKERQILQVVHCAPALAHQLQGLNVVLVGDGPWITRIEEEVAAIGQNGNLVIKMVGRQLDVRKFIALADVVLACGRSALEALACQRPVFAMKWDGFADALNNENYHEIVFCGQGYRSLTDEELVAKLIALAKDESLRQRLGVEGRHIVSKYHDIRDITTQLERIYEQYV